MLRGLHIPEFLREASLFIDEEGGPFDAHVFPAVHALFLHDAVELAHRFFRICQKREIQFIFVAEIAMAAHAVPGNAEDLIAERLKIFLMIPEGLCLHGAAGGAVLRIEIQNDLLSAVGRSRCPRRREG